MATSLSEGAMSQQGASAKWSHHTKSATSNRCQMTATAASQILTRLIVLILLLPQPHTCHKNLNTNQTAATANGTQQQPPSAPQDSAERMIMIVKNNFSNNNRNAPHNNNQQPQAVALVRSPFFKPPRAGQRSEHIPPKTSYACEGNQLELSCDEGKLIHLMRANYGRFSLSICNELGHSNLSTSCQNLRTFLHLETRCNKQSNCSVIASTEQFGDACEGTSKYLEVQYYCEDAANQTSPGQLATSRPQPPTETTPATPSQQQQGATSGHKSPNQPTARPPALPMLSEQPAQNFKDYVNENHHQTVIEDHQQELPHCASVAHTQAGRFTYWNKTRAGLVARRACPEGASGKASWLCDSTRLRFLPAWSPDFTQCRSNWLFNLQHKLDTVLATSTATSSNELLLQQSERLVKEVLQDLVLMSAANNLYSEDLKTIDQMLARILAHFRLLADLYLVSNEDKLASSSYASMFNQGLGRLFEEQLSKLVQVVSSLFEVGQRQAWLEVAQHHDRKRLELRYLNHLRASVSLLAQSLTPSVDPQQQPYERVQRQSNVFAGLTVINVPQQSRMSLLTAAAEDPKLNQQLKVAQVNLNKLVMDSDADRIGDFKIQLPVLRELVANGFTRFLVVDVKKPDYQLIRQQLESSITPAPESLLPAAAAAQEQQSGLIGELQSARVFGVFAIGAESFQVTGQQQEQRLAELLAQWPISVDFRISPQQPSQAQFNRQCNSLMTTMTTTTSDNQQQQNKCQTLRSNLTNHVCRCEQLGFISLTTVPTQLVPIGGPSGGGDTFVWQTSSFDYPQIVGSASDLLLPSSQPPASQLQPEFTTPPAAQQSNRMGLWASVFIVFGLTLLVVTLVALSINFIVRFASQRRLNKKQGFLSTGTSILGPNHHLHHHHQHHHQHLSANGPTTGPLVDHNLMSAAEPLNSSSTFHSQANIGSNQAGYKAHQQLYAAHYPPMDLCSSLAGSSETAWRRWLSRPVKWLSSATGRDHHSRMGIQHRVLGSTLTQASSVHTTYKSQFHQNGYTATGLHAGHHHHHQLHSNTTSGVGQQHQAVAALAAASQLPLAAPSSSTSSYVSSSAYYEEIGPGNLTKVNPSQMASNNTHTIVDSFKRSNQVEQQLLSTGNHHQQLGGGHHQQQVWSPAAPGATGLTYSMDQSSLVGNSSSNNNNNYHHLTSSKQPQLHNDLSQLQLQSSASSSGSQHSASTNVTTANGSTPRHYLFASPSAVSAYKSSMSQQALHHQQQQSQRFAP